MKHLYIILALALIILVHSMAYHDIPPEDFTDTAVGCYMDCTDPMPDAERLGDNINLSIKEGD